MADKINGRYNRRAKRVGKKNFPPKHVYMNLLVRSAPGCASFALPGETLDNLIQPNPATFK